jgi:hypothetical protein
MAADKGSRRQALFELRIQNCESLMIGAGIGTPSGEIGEIDRRASPRDGAPT